ncbi:ABC transporter ATP-binding protein [Cereibacter sp. SYSU M97828]|nr:ABC transporter ATP-binding protein [Cereibacter flavus]
MTELIVSKLCKSYGKTMAIQDVDFTVNDGEFVTLLGPSGCGKSTTLAAIAGLQMPTSGRIKAGSVTYFDDGKGIALPAEARDLGLVFQAYALWPHMTVRKNLEFPLRLRRIAKAEQTRRIERVLSLVEMGHLADRYPHELSGGQQQRVALARTLVYEPAILLLDEPLSNLDAKLRERARTWLDDIRHRIKLTTVYVTHDHGEALSLSDRIIVMNGGKIVQIGTPREIYEAPSDPFVADFIGSSNFLHGELVATAPGGSLATVRLEDGRTLAVTLPREIAAGRFVAVAVRPERMELVDHPTSSETGTVLEVEIRHRSYFGSHWHYSFDLGREAIRVSAAKEYAGDRVSVFIPTAACLVFETSPPAAEKRKIAKEAKAA